MSNRVSRELSWAFLALGLGAWITSTGFSDPPASQPSVEQKVTDASVPEKLSASELIENDRDAYLTEKGMSLGDNSAIDSYITWGDGAVSVITTDAAFPAARQSAYEIAVLNAEAQLIQYKNTILTADVIVTTDTNDSRASAMHDLEGKDDKTKAQVIEEKLAALADSELDTRLKALGVDPTQFDNKPKSMKIPLLRRELQKSIIKKSTGSLAGARILQTFEGHDAAGHYHMGVLIVYSTQLEGLAAVIRDGRADRKGTRDHSAEIRGKIPHDASALVSAFGVRVFYDTDGNPWVVSFGQSAPLNRGNSEIARGMLVDEAYKSARDNADSEIGQFANATLTWGREDTRSELYDNYTKKFADHDEAVELTDFLSKSQESFRQHSDLEISGLADQWTWHARHPVSGQEIYGVVRIWSPVTQLQAQQLGKPIVAPAPGGGATPPGQQGTIRGPDMN